MDREAFLTAFEEATGISRQQLALAGIEPKEGFCRRLECKGWHLVVTGTAEPDDWGGRV